MEHTETIPICYFHLTIIIATGPTHILISFIVKIISMAISMAITPFIESLGDAARAVPMHYCRLLYLHTLFFNNAVIVFLLRIEIVDLISWTLRRDLPRFSLVCFP